MNIEKYKRYKLRVHFKSGGVALTYDGANYTWEWQTDDRTLVLENIDTNRVIVIPYDNVLFFEVIDKAKEVKKNE